MDRRTPPRESVPEDAQPGPRDASRLAVLGSPIAHSRSPQIHLAAYETLGLAWRYSAVECAGGELEALLASLDDSWRGLSVTMPLKAEAHRLSSVLDPVSVESGVVNTLLRLGGGAGWAGFNTDVGGLASAIRRSGLDAARVAVLGAGATAVSAILAARALGAQRVTVFARRSEAARALVTRFDGTCEPGGTALSVTAEPLRPGLGHDALEIQRRVADTTLIISTLPAHGVDWEDTLGPLGLAPVFDVTYDPWPSPLAKRSHALGQPAHAGIEMLVEQAMLQLRIFYGGDPGSVLPAEAEVRGAMRHSVGLEP